MRGLWGFFQASKSRHISPIKFFFGAGEMVQQIKVLSTQVLQSDFDSWRCVQVRGEDPLYKVVF